MINEKSKPLRILHVEDSPRDAEIIRERLFDFDSSMHIDWASNEQEFAAFLKRGGYDVILADFQLPGFDAFAALKLKKELSSCSEIPFICISGAIGEEKAVELLKQGATDYVLKERIDKLPLALKRAIDEVKEREARRLAVEDLRETNSYLENLIKYANVPIIVWDSELIITRYNYAFEKLTGKKSEDVIANSIELLFPPDLLESSMKLINTTINGDRFDTVEIQIIHADGSRRDVLWNSANIYSSDGKTLVSTIAQGYDITERKLAEEKILQSLREKETLIRELYHRTKNTMQVIRGIIILQAEKFPMNEEIKLMVDNTDNRIQAISLVHQMLYQSQDLSQISIKKYIQELSVLILQNFNIEGDRISLNFNIDEQNFLLDTAIPFGLILNELMTNSLKYAFPEDRKGLISISLKRDSSDKYIFKYSDNGVGVHDDFDFKTQNTLGLKLIHSIAELQMMGTLVFENKDGVSCVIEFSTNLYKARV